jgi:hypothetical protein
VGLLIGASIGKEDLATYPPMLTGNNIMRIFPEDWATDKNFKVLPPWTDSRFTYCRDKGVIPFVSVKVDGNAAAIAHVKTQLTNMPAWVTTLYITDRHEPEGDVTPAAYQSNFNAFLAMVNSLPATTRAKIKCGPILTKTWTEKAGTTRSYDEHDPGTGDFFGIDMYVESGTTNSVVTPATLPSPATFLARAAAYKKSASDTRPRMFPELGVIGMPDDTTGNARAAWIQGIHDIVKTWKVGQPGWNQPWSFIGWIWWHQIGKATGQVFQIGQRRDFPLHLRTVPGTRTGAGTTADPYEWNNSSVTDLPGNPPPTIATFNAIYAAENGPTTPTAITVSVSTVTELDSARALTVTGGTPSSTPSTGYVVGATMKKEDLPKYQAMLPKNGIMRIFPNTSTGLPPAWDDPRFVYCQQNGTIPFVSSNIDGDASKFAAMRQWIIDMPSWVKVLYVTDRHEPENNFPNQPDTYKNNFTAWWNNCIANLPAATRLKVQAGHVLTRQWIEGGASKGNDNYAQYDTGLGDFYGVDMYMDSWKPGAPTQVAEQYTDPVAFLSKFKTYRLNGNDTRDRIFPELGAIGIPADPDGSKRAAWIRGLCAELDTWTVAAQGWRFIGWIWWNNIDSGGASSLTPIGTGRYFYLDQYQADASGPQPLPGSPPAPVVAFNQMALAHPAIGSAVDPGNPDPDPDPDPDPGGGTDPGTNPNPTPGGATNLPADLPGAARLMAADYTLLITDKNLNVLGDPVSSWTSIDVTLRFNEPSSGQFTTPGYPWVRQQIVPGARVVCIRHVLGTSTVVAAGPIESATFERSDDGENAGDGTFTVTWADDMAWIAGRLTYPNPALTPEGQNSDNWLWTGNAELGMRALVDGNAGPSALAPRRVPKLALGAVASVGTDISITADDKVRFIPVTDALRLMAQRGGNLGFRTRQSMSQNVILFEVYEPDDLSGQIRFGFGLGNLKYIAYEVTAPEVNATIVGGQGTGADRFVIERSDPLSIASWGRLEVLTSRPGNDARAALEMDGDSALVEGGEGVRLSSNAADTVDCRYGIHYDLGDIVSIEVWPGTQITEVVRTVHIQAYPTAGEVVGITIGDQSTSNDYGVIDRMRRIDRRVGALERNTLPYKPPTT